MKFSKSTSIFSYILGFSISKKTYWIYTPSNMTYLIMFRLSNLLKGYILLFSGHLPFQEDIPNHHYIRDNQNDTLSEVICYYGSSLLQCDLLWIITAFMVTLYYVMDRHLFQGDTLLYYELSTPSTWCVIVSWTITSSRVTHY